MPTADHTLSERTEELTELRRVVRAARSGCGHALVIDGAPGVGRSELLRWAQQDARRARMTCLTANGSALERGFEFGVVRQLFDPLLGSDRHLRAKLTKGCAALAAPLFGDDPGAPPALGPGGDYDRLRGLNGLAEALARRTPLLISIDDAEQSDADSLRWILYLVNRIEGLPIAVVLAAHVGEPGGQRMLLEHLIDERRALLVRPRPLSRQAVAGIARATFGATDAEFSDACHALTGGNPLLFHELLAEARSGSAEEVERLHAVRLPNVVRWLRQRFENVPSAAGEIAQAMAILGDGCTIAEAAALAALSDDEAAAAADTLAQMEMIENERPLRFCQPIVRIALHSELPVGRRHARHAHAARVVADAGAPPERVAAQLLSTEPHRDPWASEMLRAAAHTALQGGAPQRATAYLTRALAERPPAWLHGELLFELGTAGAQVAAAPALDHLARAYEEATDDQERGRRALQLGRALAMADSTRDAVSVLTEAAERIESAPPDLHVRLESDLIGIARLTPGLPALARRRLPAFERMVVAGSADERVLLCHRAFDTALAGGSAEQTSALARRALEDEGLLRCESNPMAFAQAIHALWVAGDYDFAWARLRSAAGDAAGRGSILELVIACLLQARFANAFRRVDDAKRLAISAVELALAHGWRLLLPLGVASVMDAEIARGDLAAADELVSGVHSPEAAPEAALVHELYASRGRLRLLQGDAEAALSDALAAGAALRELEAPNPAVAPWRSLAARAHLALGEGDEARRLAGEELELARAFGAAPALGLALRTVAAVEPGPRARAQLVESAAVLAQSSAMLEHAITLTDLGAAERRAGRRKAAREPLRQALDIAGARGARAVAERAEKELVATGARPRRTALSGPDALTPSERRVAELASLGATNRDIARMLVITVKTVETHLAHVYRKLDVTSRADIAALLDPE